MLPRTMLKALFVASFVISFIGCASNQVDSIQVTPGTDSIATGKTLQYTAMATEGHAGHASQNVTNSVMWSSSDATVATVSSAGVATAVGSGTTTITATTTGFGGQVSGTAALTVTGGGGGGGNADISTIAIIPGAQSVSSPTETSQFIAIGTTTTGATENITTSVLWSSSSTQVATITPGGLATGVNQGTTTITAIYTNPDQTVVTGTATFTVIAGAAEQITSLTIYPGSQAATAQAQQSQFFVLGVQGNGLTYDETAQVVWTSSNEAVATIGNTGSGIPGLATAVGAGTTTITATWTNKDSSKVVSTATYSVTIGAAQEPLLSITIVPGNVTVSNKGMTAQFLAFGTFSTTPTVRDLTNSVTWISALPEVASVNSGGTPGEAGGLVTAQGYTGLSDIYAEAINKDTTVVLSNPVTFTCKDSSTNECDQEVAYPQFATITVFNAGENATTWLVTAPSDTGTPNLIHCGPGSPTGGSVCTGTYETGSTVTLTASPTGSGFGGWSSGDGVSGGVACTAANGDTLLNSPTCTVTLTGNASVGAIFY
jgi:hypothetical protein